MTPDGADPLPADAADRLVRRLARGGDPADVLWGRRRVAYALKKLGLPARRVDPDGRLALESLSARVRLPHHLANGYHAGRKLAGTQRLLTAVWFNKPHLLPFVRAWAGLSARADGRANALVFPMKGVPPGLVVRPVAPGWVPGAGPAWVFPYPTPAGGVARLGVERFDDYLAGLAAAGRPAVLAEGPR